MTGSSRLDGQVALVTGGSRGIGKAVALALAARGAHVAVLSRTLAGSEAAAGEIRALGRRAVASAGDVRNWADVQRQVREVADALGPVDVLINNAGLGGPHGYIWDLDPDAFGEALLTNVVGPFHFMKAALPGMVERHRGVVVNLSSGNARNVGVARSMYGASKSALDYVSRVAALEAAPAGVRVYAFYPGATDTDMQTHLRSDPALPEPVRVNLQARFTEGRVVQPEQPAAAIAWLATPDGAAWTDPICPWSTPEVRARIEEWSLNVLPGSSRESAREACAGD